MESASKDSAQDVFSVVHSILPHAQGGQTLLTSAVRSAVLAAHIDPDEEALSGSFRWTWGMAIGERGEMALPFFDLEDVGNFLLGVGVDSLQLSPAGTG